MQHEGHASDLTALRNGNYYKYATFGSRDVKGDVAQW